MHLVVKLVEMRRSGAAESGQRLSKVASAARRLADEIVPMWSNATATNTMEYETALRAMIADSWNAEAEETAMPSVDKKMRRAAQFQVTRPGASDKARRRSS